MSLAFDYSPSLLQNTSLQLPNENMSYWTEYLITFMNQVRLQRLSVVILNKYKPVDCLLNLSELIYDVINNFFPSKSPFKYHLLLVYFLKK